MLKYLITKGYVNVSKILLSIYPRLNMTEEEVVVVLKLFEMLKNNQVSISVSELSKKMVMGQNELSNILASLYNKDLLSLDITYNKDGKAKELFNLDNLICKMNELFEEERKALEEKVNTNILKQMISLVEDTFKRSLSPFELEMISSWAKENETIDRVRQALAIATKDNKLNIKYVDGCLARLDQNITTNIDDTKSKLLADFYRNLK